MSCAAALISDRQVACMTRCGRSSSLPRRDGAGPDVRRKPYHEVRRPFIIGTQLKEGHAVPPVPAKGRVFPNTSLSQR